MIFSRNIALCWHQDILCAEVEKRAMGGAKMLAWKFPLVFPGQKTGLIQSVYAFVGGKISATTPKN